MSGLGGGAIFPNAGAVLPSLTDWLTLTLALTWTAAGLLLLFFGWISLPRKPDDDSAPGSTATASGGSTAIRVLAGVALAVGAFAVGSLVLGHGTVWGALALTGMGVLALLGYALLLHAPYSSTLGPLSALTSAAGKTWGWLEPRLEWIGFQVMRGVRFAGGWLHHELPIFGALVVAGLSSAWQDRGYALVNLIAIVLTVAVGGFAGWMSSSSRWKTSGVVTFLGLDFIAMGLIAFSLIIVEHAHGPWSQGLGIWLLGIELLGMFLFLAYQFYTLEFLTGKERAPGADAFPIDPTWTPNVLVQVASYNEPPAIVEQCLDSVLRLEYPRDKFLVQLADDSTDPVTVARLSAFCAARGIYYQHRTDRRGFKGGALNDGLHAIASPVDLIAIVDSDYEVEPQFLRVGVQPFREKEIGFVQTPQAYRNAGRGTFARWYALADAYFYRVIQPVRARAQSMIFCGTMGLLRREALESAGGWSETCVTEDAELSLRLLAGGWKGHYVPTILGWGLAPDLMSAVRSQHRRWAFGGMQMLKMNREKLGSEHLSLRQRVDFRMGGLFWVDGLFLMGVTAAVASLVVATWFGVSVPIGSTAALAVIASAPLLLMLDGLVKIRIALRASTPVTFRDALGIMAFWYAIKINDLRAALRGWWGSSIPFVRTPKDAHPNPGRATALAAALRGSAFETSIAAVLIAILGVTAYRWGLFRGHPIALGSVTLLVWLGYYAAAFISALVFDYISRRTLVGDMGAAPPSPAAPVLPPVSATGPTTETGSQAAAAVSPVGGLR
jgi:cellulose synthase/poly-beta-1,6-N-acetylglucosamine synthase-like glycosyltransferase